MNSGLSFDFIAPPDALQAFVECFGVLRNVSGEPREVVVLPDGRIDLFLWQSANQPFQIMLMGLETLPEKRSVPPHTKAFVISFKPLAIEYVLHTAVADIVDSAKILSGNFWDFTANDLEDFNTFCNKATQKMLTLIPLEIEEKKRRLFELLYASKGQIRVQELSGEIFWTSRQINRYFTKHFGLPLKTYASILRFRNALEHIAEGKLFPALDFADQAYFIKAIKKFAGVVPKELFKNENDRFVLLSVLQQK